MPNYTTNYNLTKPLETEKYDIKVQNGNMDKIDTAVGGLQAEFDGLEQELATYLTNYAKQMDLKIKNEVVNGNFSKGATDWLFLKATYELLYDYNIKFTGDLGYIYQNIYGIQGEKWYVKYDFTKTTEAGEINVLLNESTASVDYNKNQIIVNAPSGSPAGTNIKGSDVISLNANHKILGFSSYPSPGVNRYFRANELFAVNLTATFGAGNEPTKEEMDMLVSLVPNNWWDGELKPSQKLLLNWQLKVIRNYFNALLGGA